LVMCIVESNGLKRGEVFSAKKTDGERSDVKGTL
jgi:hypothetical protein